MTDTSFDGQNPIRSEIVGTDSCERHQADTSSGVAVRAAPGERVSCEEGDGGLTPLQIQTEDAAESELLECDGNLSGDSSDDSEKGGAFLGPQTDSCKGRSDGYGLHQEEQPTDTWQQILFTRLRVHLDFEVTRTGPAARPSTQQLFAENHFGFKKSSLPGSI